MQKELDERAIRMLSRSGCIDLFWEELQRARAEDPAVTREEVFNRMNEHFKDVTGMFRYIDYESFRASMNKKA